MFRLLGFLIGSLTSIVIILLIVGLPEFRSADPLASQDRYDAALEKLRARQKQIETVTGELSEHVARVAATMQAEPDPPGDTRSAPAEAPPESPPPVVPASTVTAMPVLEPSWYSFWNPFRSELAANGFVSQLERVTGLDYRVVKVKTGVYEVAFAYADDGERRTKLAQISAATGLELPDS